MNRHERELPVCRTREQGTLHVNFHVPTEENYWTFNFDAITLKKCLIQYYSIENKKPKMTCTSGIYRRPNIDPPI